jgi:alpha-1,2-mannosyltransferase
MLFSAGMWSSAVAFLPSTFAMYANMLAWSYAFDLPSRLNNQRTLLACVFFAAGAVVGWPFSAALAVPFVLEEMFAFGRDHIKSNAWNAWLTQRWIRLARSVALASLVLVGTWLDILDII